VTREARRMQNTSIAHEIIIVKEDH